MAPFLLALFRGGFLRANSNAPDFHSRQLSAVSDGAMITFTPFELKRDHFFIFALLDNFGSDLCLRNERITVRHVFPVSIHQHIAERRGLTRLDIEKIDINRVDFRDAVLPSASLDYCVRHTWFCGISCEKGLQR